MPSFAAKSAAQALTLQAWDDLLPPYSVVTGWADSFTSTSVLLRDRREPYFRTPQARDANDVSDELRQRLRSHWDACELDRLLPPDTLPYLMTIVVLVFVSTGWAQRRLGAPAALGVSYVREER